MKKYLPEFIGAFAIVFCGTGSIIINQVSGGVIGHAGIAVTFGLIVMAMVYVFPGAQFNPAVTLALSFGKLFPKGDIFKNILFQAAGAISASVVLKWMFPESTILGATLPAGSELQSFVLEIILMFFLLFAILKVENGAPEIKNLNGIVVGAVVLLEAMFAGPISGASMNPARSLAPALVSGNFQSLWIYLTAPLLGALLAMLVYKKGNQPSS